LISGAGKWGRTGMFNHDPILDRLRIGSCPQYSDHVDALSQEGITAVFNAQTVEDFSYMDVDWDALSAYYLQRDIIVKRIAVRDFHDDDLQDKLPACVDAVAELLGQNHFLYVHCNVGLNRAPTVAIAYLHWKLGWDLEQAERFVGEKRKCAPRMEVIRRATADLEQ
ncbi:MAG: dual specificity protein phosphatase family protein, partial [Planctomycetales bacterium]